MHEVGEQVLKVPLCGALQSYQVMEPTTWIIWSHQSVRDCHNQYMSQLLEDTSDDTVINNLSMCTTVMCHMHCAVLPLYVCKIHNDTLPTNYISDI